MCENAGVQMKGLYIIKIIVRLTHYIDNLHIRTFTYLHIK